MDYEDSFQPRGTHRVVLEDREQAVISGVEEVARFDENEILLTTVEGGLELRGEELHIEALSLEGGELHVRGRIQALVYDAEPEVRGGLLRRLLGG